MQPLKIDDLCVTLIGTHDSFTGDVTCNSIKIGEQVVVVGCGNFSMFNANRSDIANVFVYRCATRDGRHALYQRSSLLKISPDAFIKLEQVRESLKTKA